MLSRRRTDTKETTSGTAKVSPQRVLATRKNAPSSTVGAAWPLHFSLPEEATSKNAFVENIVMIRCCSHCQKELSTQELSIHETMGMETERMAKGLDGMAFRYYACAGCGNADIFVHVFPLRYESEENFRTRRHELETVIGQLRSEEVDVILA